MLPLVKAVERATTNVTNLKKGGSRRGGNTTVVSETQTAAAEPDPRWAQDLAKLKEMLACANNTFLS